MFVEYDMGVIYERVFCEISYVGPLYINPTYTVLKLEHGNKQ